MSVFKNNYYLCTCELTPSHLAKRLEGLMGGSTTLRNASLTLCSWQFETSTNRISCRNNAEVDATGRYIPFPWVCRWLTMPSRTPFGGHYVYHWRGYHSVCLQLRLWKASNCETGRRQIPRFLFVVESKAYSVRFGYSADDKLNDGSGASCFSILSSFLCSCR